ncbi:MAG TPA: calcium-translocating P-type ATPase, SERCA-type [Candidatus Nanoarchaeia archaeon]|nr:calcium-translocating P-type ATPase, SERCA-type [Candidatus Nanoarchaeia archaeon]
MDAYRLSEKEVLRELDSSLFGLSKEAVSRRLEEYGPNVLKEEPRKPWWRMFLEEFKDVMVLMLLGALLVSLLLGEHTDAIFIFVVVILNAIIGYIQEYKAEESLQALKKMMSPEAKVIRNGVMQDILAKDLVPGDILVLEEGDKIPADARLLEVVSLAVDESALTGESVPRVKKLGAFSKKEGIADQDNMVFLGTIIARGKGRAVVTATGMKTEFGKIAGLTQQLSEVSSPLQKELDLTGKVVAKGTVAICLFMFLFGIAVGNSWMMMFLFAVSLVVAAVPESLPAIVTITLALGVQKMVKKNAIVRRLSSVETLGSTTVICSDKTGTLTKNEMTVKEIWVNSRVVDVEGSGYKPQGRFLLGGKAYEDETLELLLKGSALCSDAVLTKEFKIIGDPTEGALVVAAEKYGLSVDSLRKSNKVFEEPFDSSRKLMSVVHEENKKLRVFTKGAPDRVVELCNKAKINGKLVPFSAKLKEDILGQNMRMAKGALRVLGVAYKELPRKASLKSVESDLVFLGLIGMMDPPREEVKTAVAECKQAGIRIFVITGDHGITAKAITMELGIADESTRIVTGQELGCLRESDLKEILCGKAIFARASPEDKMRIVSCLKDLGEIVAVTGDGVNDAPALKRGDIGVSMGKSGTDVAREASDIVLVDDSFASIVAAIREGRVIYSNIKKFIRYIFSSNLGEIFTVFLGMLLYPASLVISAIQILWTNLATDALPALALGLEQGEKEVMERSPRNPKKRLITAKQFYAWSGFGMVMAICTLGIFFLNVEELDKAKTMAFSTLIFCELVNALSCRSNKKSLFSIGIWGNKYLLGGVLISFVLQFVVVEWSFFQEVFHTVSLSVLEWVEVIVFSLMVFVYEEVRKYISFVRWKRGFLQNTSSEAKGL